jgi:hypothetical protein
MLTSGFWPRCAPVICGAPVFLVAVTSKTGRYASLLPCDPPKIYVRDSNPCRPCDELSIIKKKRVYPGIELWTPASQACILLLDHQGSVADPKLLFRIRYRIRIRPLVSFGFGSGFRSGFESGFESCIRIRIQILDLNPDQKQAKTSFS